MVCYDHHEAFVGPSDVIINTAGKPAIVAGANASDLSSST